MASNDKLIEIEDLTKVFYTDEVETHALSGIHLTISRASMCHVRPFRLRQIHAALDSCLLDTPRRKYLLNGSPVRTELWRPSRIRNQEIGSSFRASI